MLLSRERLKLWKYRGEFSHFLSKASLCLAVTLSPLYGEDAREGRLRLRSLRHVSVSCFLVPI